MGANEKVYVFVTVQAHNYVYVLTPAHAHALYIHKCRVG